MHLIANNYFQYSFLTVHINESTEENKLSFKFKFILLIQRILVVRGFELHINCIGIVWNCLIKYFKLAVNMARFETFVSGGEGGLSNIMHDVLVWTQV